MEYYGYVGRTSYAYAVTERLMKWIFKSLAQVGNMPIVIGVDLNADIDHTLSVVAAMD